MITLINYWVPFFGLILCLVAIFNKRINTKTDLRIIVVVMWLIVWMTVIYYDYPYEIDKVLSITFVRVVMLIINALYILEAAIGIKKVIPINLMKCNKHAP